MLKEVYVVTSDGVYEGDYNHTVEVYKTFRAAEKAYNDFVNKALQDCTTSDGEKPLDITDLDPDDYDGTLEGKYVFEQHLTSDDTANTLVYSYGAYAEDHIEIMMKKAEVKDADDKPSPGASWAARKHL